MARGSEEEKAAEGGMKGKRTPGVSTEAQVGSKRRSLDTGDVLLGIWLEVRIEGDGGVHERTKALQLEIKAKAITKRYKPDMKRALCKFNLLEIRE